jgi:hypothetical protein
METLKDFLWPIVLVGGLGAFIDFLIGKTGQERAKDFLLRWWVRFDDVRWKNFGREEGLFSGRLIEKWFWQRLWGVRRITAAFVLLAVFLCLGFLKFSLMGFQPDNFECEYCDWPSRSDNLAKMTHAILFNTQYNNLVCFYCGSQAELYTGVRELFLCLIGFCISVSFTKFITVRMTYLCRIGKFRNLVIFLFFQHLII